MSPSLDIIIVNWNSGGQLRACLASIQAANRQNFDFTRVVVVDNASCDGSADDLHDGALPLTLIRNTENHGFAAACNCGAKTSQADYLLFLNPDVRLISNSLSEPVAFMEKPENAKVGICGIQLLDEQGQVSRTCSRFPTAFTYFSRMLGLDRLFPNLFPGHFLETSDHGQSREVDQVMGAFLLIRRTLFDRLGGFDERFFVYFEDLDLSYRAFEAGWQSHYLATAQAYHKGGGCSEGAKAARLFYSLRSRILYSYKHFGWASATGLLAGTLLVEPFARLAWAAWRGSMQEMRATLGAYAMLWRALPALFSEDGLASGREGNTSTSLPAKAQKEMKA
ncbi:MAG TPA: glycosyltransferase family 2 protein [Candidatus Dormibacteraeota bacterium]|nr:glycosyltransferase family 2 protein [Candidatus Dormibacteraeota bacterium]